MKTGGQHLTVLWRGTLASCNYGCDYCPFAKTQDDRSALRADRLALERFEHWVTSRPYPVSILFTPWGEALIRNYYRSVMKRLSNAPNVSTVAIQTNLSCSTAWMSEVNRKRFALWTTYHPGESSRDQFVRKVEQLQALGIRYSVGIVGLKQHMAEIDDLRSALPKEAYLWVNAYKRVAGYYTAEEVDKLIAIDPLFELNLRSYDSLGRACHAGESVISVIADGTARRCHFLPAPIGNIYAPDFEDALRPRACSGNACRCHIGYSHLKDLDLETLFGQGLLERKPPVGMTPEHARAHIQSFTESGQVS
jgi:MoaA/NifB/PqqE/SkfB family radical SAM enzyme